MPHTQTIHTLLIANRGEIATRIIHTAHALGIKTIAIYAPEDQYCPYVYQAHQSLMLPDSGTYAYLNATAIIGIAKQSGANAVHPGYGFLAENATFAQMVLDAGLIWVGPNPEHIALMGDKGTARAFAQQHNIPIIPGTHLLESDHLAAEKGYRFAEDIGFPVLLKAALGGGGKAMSKVESKNDYITAWHTVSTQAKKLFGSADIVVEKYIENGRHIEIQIAGDGEDIVHFFERDCTIQRRHQKIIEESPCAFVAEETLKLMYTLATNAIRAINYKNIGTLEFIVGADEQFYFLEMNTRLQVEHAITELTCGIDLVALQLSLAQGFPLPYKQEDISRKGHAIECRINAEDERFLPSCGTINHLTLPNGPWIRFDHALIEGLEISPFFDSMVGKLIVISENRTKAIQWMLQALSGLSVDGVTLNTLLHQKILQTNDFKNGNFHTRWLETRTLPNADTFNSLLECDESPAIIAALLLHMTDHSLIGKSSPIIKRNNWRTSLWQ